MAIGNNPSNNNSLNTEELEITKEDIQSVPFDVTVSQENTRAKIAWFFTVAFISIVSLCIIGPFIINLISPTSIEKPLETAKELVTIITSILAGPFGFIVGFYFKEQLGDG